MANQNSTLKASGLHTNSQTLMEVPPGSLLTANNTVINRDGVIEPRRGIKLYSTSPSPVKQLIEYKERVIRHAGSKLSLDSGPGTYTDFTGEYSEFSSGFRINHAEAKSNLYFTTSEGVKKISIESFNSTPPEIQDSGGPKAIAGTLALVAGPGFLPINEKVSYRILWIYEDANKNLIFGAPSAPMTIANGPTETKNVQLTFQIPYNVTSSVYKYRIYRSETSTVPSDELYQVIEASPTSAQLTDKKIIIIDTASEDSRVGGVPLYTNQNSGEGILKSNEPPPAARDIAMFKGHMFYANTRTRHAVQIQLLKSTGLTGTFFYIKSGNITSPAYDLLDKGSIEESAKSLVDKINSNPDEVVTAYYLSVAGEAEGKIYLQRKTLVDIPFYLNSTAIEAFSPNIPIPSATGLISTTEAIPNRLYYSKYQEIEAVPLLNYIDVGSKEQKILRVITLRESLFILKEDGVFRLSGDAGINPIWNVNVFDNTSIIKAPDTAVTLGNQCYYFGNKGIVRLNETSIDSVSDPIKNKLVPFLTTNQNLPKLSFSVAYESDNALLVWTCSDKNDTEADVCYRFHTGTQTWTEWRIKKTCAALHRKQDKLYFGSSNSVDVERKDFNRFDYSDYELPLSLSSNSLNGTILKPTGLLSISVGDVIMQEQYITIYKYNSLLRKLDIDNGLNQNTEFYRDYKINTGENLTSKINTFVARLDSVDDTSTYSWSNSTDIAVMRSEFNTIVSTLNSSPKALFSNYVLIDTSSPAVKQECIVTAIDLLRKEVTVNVEPSFVVGSLILHKGISTDIEYAPQHMGDPSGFKQFSFGTFMFERRSFYSAQVSYNSDLSDNYEEISFSPNSSGIFGGASWGDGTIWGGLGDQAQIDTYIPLKKQRCRFLGCRFFHTVALESFQLYGISLVYRPYANVGRK